MAFTSLRLVLNDWLKKRKLEKLFNKKKTPPARRTGPPMFKLRRVKRKGVLI